MEKTEYLLIDLGAVIYDINYQKTIDELSVLFNEDLYSFFSKKSQWEHVDLFEEGKITGDMFCDFLKDHFNKPEIDNHRIKDAWNALLIGFREETVLFLENLSKSMDLYLYSNTNEYHYNELSRRAGEEFMNRFHKCFKTVYLSHTFGHRKPHAHSFTTLLEKEGLNPEKGLFIDDTLHHVNGAKEARLSTYHFQSHDRLENVIPTLLNLSVKGAQAFVK